MELAINYMTNFKHGFTSHRLSQEYLASQVQELVKQMKEMTKKCKNGPKDLQEHSSHFLKQADQEMKLLTENLDSVLHKSKEAAEYFCEDPKKFKVDGLLGEIHGFISELENAAKVS